jgi:hypothetical protein
LCPSKLGDNEQVPKTVLTLSEKRHELTSIQVALGEMDVDKKVLVKRNEKMGKDKLTHNMKIPPSLPLFVPVHKE